MPSSRGSTARRMDAAAKGRGRPPFADASRPVGDSRWHFVRVSRELRDGLHGHTMTACQTVVMTTPDGHHMSETPGQQGASQGATAVFTMREAAEVAGVSVSTLRRRRADLIAAGAVIDARGWQVPITSLIAAGLISSEGERPSMTQPASSYQSRSQPSDEDEVGRLREEIRQLERQSAEWQRRAEVAEARAEERGKALETLRLANESERMALRMLTGQNPASAPSSRQAQDLASSTPDAPIHPQKPAPRSGRRGLLGRFLSG